MPGKGQFKPVDETLVLKLASIHCTNVEIAYLCNVSVDLIETKYSGIVKEGRARGKASLRRAQWELAQKGNVAMLIWLGKTLLGQSDQKYIVNLPLEDHTDQVKEIDRVVEKLKELRDDRATSI